MKKPVNVEMIVMVGRQENASPIVKKAIMTPRANSMVSVESARASTFNSVWGSVFNSVWDSGMGSVSNSVSDSVSKL